MDAQNLAEDGKVATIETTEFTQDPNAQAPETTATTDFSNTSGNGEQSTTPNNDNNTGVEEFAKKNNNEEDKNKDDSGAPADEGGEKKSGSDDEDDEEKKKAAKNALVAEELDKTKAEFAELQNKYASLEEQYNQLVAFKASVEEKEKDDLIASFYMLSDEDKADVIANKAQYSLDDIESKLSVICVRKKVSFVEEKEDKDKDVAITFNLNSHQADTLPAWLKAVEAYKQIQDN